MADHAGPAADVALADRPAARRGERPVDVVGRHVEAVDVVQQPVPRLAHDRERPVRRPERQRPDRVPDDPVADDADRWVFVIPIGAGQQARLADPFEARQLAVPVQAVAARVDGLRPDVAVVGDDRGDAGSDRALADDERALAPDQRRVTDPDARHVRDRVGRTRPAPADDDPQIPCSHPLRLLGPWAARSIAHPAIPPYHRPVIRSPGAGSAPVVPRRAAGGPPCPRRGPPGAAARGRGPPADRRGGGLPRPARPRPARERPARAAIAVDLPLGRSGRGPDRARGRGGSVRGGPRLLARLADAPPEPVAGATRRRSSAGSSASSATSSATSWSGCRRRRRTTRTCHSSGSPSTTGRSPGTVGRGPRGWPVARSTATPGGSAGGCARSASGAIGRRSSRPASGRRRGAAREPEPELVFRSSLDRPAYEAGRRGDPRSDRRRRDLPGEPDPATRDAVRRRPVAALPPAADRRSVAVLGVPRPRPRRAGSRLRARQRAGAAAGDPVRLARAVPRGRRATAASRPTRSRAPGRAAGRATRTGRSPASSCSRRRTAPRT